MLFNTERERNMSLGRQYKFDPLEYGECNVHKDAMEDLSIAEGDIVYITLSYTNLMETILTKYNSYAKKNGQSTVETTRSSSIRIPCKVKRSID
jgi:hypothetical protein